MPGSEKQKRPDAPNVPKKSEGYKKMKFCESSEKEDLVGSLQSAGSDRTMKCQDGMRIIPILPNDVLDPVSVVPVYAAAVLDKKNTSALLRQLSNLYPLEGLSHIKRVRKQTVKYGTHDKEELQIILCETSKIALPKTGEITLSCILKDDIDEELLGKPFTAYVPRMPPQTKARYEEASRFWPTAYHEDKELNRLISGEQFSVSDRAKIQANILKAVRKANVTKHDGKPGIGALIVDPRSDTTVAMTSSCPGRGENPLQHAVMKCIDLVAHSQGGGAWTLSQEDTYCRSLNDNSSTEETPYLCTGFDLYISQEPCIMCAMALVHSRIRRVFYTTSQPDGALGSRYKLHTESSLNHRYQAFKVEICRTELPGHHLDNG